MYENFHRRTAHEEHRAEARVRAAAELGSGDLSTSASALRGQLAREVGSCLRFPSLGTSGPQLSPAGAGSGTSGHIWIPARSRGVGTKGRRPECVSCAPIEVKRERG
ncbi:hypothetical protein AGIG_G5176 [Arapaima gigas]